MGYRLRRGAVITGIPYVTTYQGASAALRAVRWLRTERPEFRSLNELHSLAAGQRVTRLRVESD
jgi:carbamoyl-phosphate synthase large subunit